MNTASCLWKQLNFYFLRLFLNTRKKQSSIKRISNSAEYLISPNSGGKSGVLTSIALILFLILSNQARLGLMIPEQNLSLHIRLRHC